MNCFVFFLLSAFGLWLVSGNVAAQTPQFGKLEPGAYAVGFRVVQQYDYSRTVKPKNDWAGQATQGESAALMQIGVWYPAKAASTAARLRYEEYLWLNQKSESFTALTEADKQQARKSLGETLRFAFNHEATEQELQTILSAPMAAIRDAEPESGRFPIILGGLGKVGNTSVLAEYLASHGYVVATVGRHAHIGTLQVLQPQVALEWHTRNFEYLLPLLRTYTFADLNRVGVLGVNFDGMAALNFQMRNQLADAVVSLDGWESKNFSAATARQSPYFDALKLRAPYLLFLQDKPPNPGLQFDAAFFHSLKYAERYFYQVNQLEHAAYVANPLALPLLDATKRTGVEFVYQSVLYFLNAYVKKDARSLAWLKRSAEANGFSKELLKAETKLPALPPAPTAAEFEQLLGVGLGQDGSSLTRGIEVFRAAKKADPELTLFSVPGINMFAFRMKRQNKPEAALALLKLGVEAYPQSATALDNLGSAYLEFGRPERALECFTQALALVADDPDLNEGEKAQFRNELQQKFNRLKGAK